MERNLVTYLRTHRRWAMEPGALEGVVEAAHEMQAETPGISSARGRRLQATGSVGIISILGPLSYRSSLFSLVFGGSTVFEIQQALRAARADNSVKTIVLDIDSPGGAVDGIPELAAEILQLRRHKPVIAVANTLAASAAYWIASQADEVVITPSGLAGSIGVWLLHQDLSRAMDAAGITNTFIFAGKHKVEGNPLEPLSKVARADWQKEVNTIYGDFISDVARGRQTTVSEVRASYGDGRVYQARDAVALGLADRIGTLDEVVGELSRPGSRRRAALLEGRRQRQARADRDREIVDITMTLHGIRGEPSSDECAAQRDRDILLLTEALA